MNDHNVEPLIYVGDDFDEWVSTQNPNRLPVVQYQQPRDQENPDRLGGCVLQKPTPNDWLAIPLHAQNERGAVAEAKNHLRDVPGE
jgi:hypothetical protein